ncbi:MAG TPA: ABC transporter ATP-binding protein [Bryobacteraceae bacterium]|jgi:ABC-2 type transport system ATP-binding protein|nr:ABC transporter ATP-binding protein [Bryobacteraceae bacterium]
MNEILRTIQLSKRFGKTLVLDRMDMSVPEGSIYGLLGPNGAGKSTTLQLLMNIHQASSGCAEIFGHDSRRISPRDFTQIGYVAESQEMPDWMSVAGYMAYLQPFYPDWDSTRAEQLLRQFDLPPERKLRNLSRGMRMKAALASSLAYHPRLIVMDEPFGGLDSLVRDEVIEGLLANAEGASILISSHDLAEIESFASHIGYLDRGRLQFSEEMASLTERFREVEVTVDRDPRVPTSAWPASWLNTEQSGSLIRFIETQFQRERTMAEVRRLFQDAKQVAVKAMPLRSIFVTLAKASRKAA